MVRCHRGLSLNSAAPGSYHHRASNDVCDFVQGARRMQSCCIRLSGSRGCAPGALPVDYLHPRRLGSMTGTQRLLADARGGDPRAFDALLDRHRGRLTAFVASRMHPGLRGWIEPDDIVQEVSLEASRKIGEFEDRHPNGFYAWLVRIARFKLSEADRRRRAHHCALVQPRRAGRLLKSVSARPAANIRAARAAADGAAT